jgi:hypothetical protein
MNQKILNELDKQFPKGDKSRGKALVLHSVAQIELDKVYEDIMKTIKQREGKLDIGTLTRIYNYCKKRKLK